MEWSWEIYSHNFTFIFDSLSISNESGIKLSDFYNYQGPKNQLFFIKN